MFLVPESEQRILKGLEIRSIFVQKVEGYVRFFIGLSNGSVLVATTPETAESIINIKELVKKTEQEIQLDKGPLAQSRECETTMVYPDLLEHELRIIRQKIFYSGMIALCPMDTPANRKGSFEEFGKDFKEWYLSLEIPR